MSHFLARPLDHQAHIEARQYCKRRLISLSYQFEGVPTAKRQPSGVVFRNAGCAAYVWD